MCKPNTLISKWTCSCNCWFTYKQWNSDSIRLNTIDQITEKNVENILMCRRNDKWFAWQIHTSFIVSTYHSFWRKPELLWTSFATVSCYFYFYSEGLCYSNCKLNCFTSGPFDNTSWKLKWKISMINNKKTTSRSTLTKKRIKSYRNADATITIQWNSSKINKNERFRKQCEWDV